MHALEQHNEHARDTGFTRGEDFCKFVYESSEGNFKIFWSYNVIYTECTRFFPSVSNSVITTYQTFRGTEELSQGTKDLHQYLLAQAELVFQQPKI